MTRDEMAARGWEELDVLLVSGDAYVDHPSFGVALLARLLEAEGYRVGVVAQPRWDSTDDVARMGRPRLFAGVTAGAVDSMLARYTAARKTRRDDPYSPAGRAGMRPTRATIVYTNLVQRAFPGLPVVIGGLEASLRRLAHYDYWDNAVRRSLLLDSKASLLVYGMAERQIVEIARRLRAGESLSGIRGAAQIAPHAEALPAGAVRLPSFEQVASDKRAFMEMTREAERQANPCCAAPLAQAHGGRWLVVHPPAEPLSTAEMDRLYELPFARRAHPFYREPIPALDPVEFSITVVRGCFGGCAFCTLGLHQGKIIQSRSEASVLREARALIASPRFRGTITDLGGPTANMYALGCANPAAQRLCRRPSCLWPDVCRNLGADHGAQIRLLRAVRRLPGVKHVFISSGVRHDLALLDLQYVEELVAHHVSGHLKVAPEHVSEDVLRLMRKPSFERYDEFQRHFDRVSQRARKKQYLLPYLIAGHPGASAESAQELAQELRRRGLRVEQAQEFLPIPMTVSTAQYYTGLNPETLEPIPVPQAAAARREKNVITKARPHRRRSARRFR
mgnify:CR=1 FL=1